ncbi:MAG TPA: hypothetical protein VK671_10400 [Mucilaginibacter sp.]|nr:hypothetical protein [Mucilaginibacter sp.]
MKIIASILIMYFGLLIMQPFAHMEAFGAKPAKACNGDKCCKEQGNHKKAIPCNDASACNTDFCNPFVPCGISIAQRTIQIKFENPVLELPKIKKPAANDDIISNYLSDCWRPPKLS